MFLSKLTAGILATALTVAVACTGGVATGPGAAYSDSLREALAAQPEVTDALARIDEGRCEEVLPLLTVYAGQEDRTELLDYLLGRAYLCAGESLKGAHHLRQAWIYGQALRADVRAAARAGADALVKRFAENGGLPYGQLRAGYLLLAFGRSGWYSPDAGMLLQAYAGKLQERGDYRMVLRVADVLSRIGAPTEECFDVSMPAHIRLGEREAVERLVTERNPSGEALHALGIQAEKAFRHGIASWLFEQCRARECPAPTIGLDLARSYLKEQRLEDARKAWQGYLAGAGDALAARTLEVTELLQRHDHLEEAHALLDAARRQDPGSFNLARALAALHEKLPEKVDAARILLDYLVARKFDREALDQVGGQCVEWKLHEAGAQVAAEAAEAGADKDLVHFFRGAFLWLAGRKGEAQKAFDRAVDAAADQAAMLDRVATFLLGGGDSGAARDYFQRALKRSPGATSVMLKLATLLEQEKGGRGLGLLRQRLAGDGAPAAGLVAAARWCEEKGYGAEALDFARRAVAASSDEGRAAAHMTYGTLLLHRFQYGEAVNQYRQALKSSTELPVTAGEILERWAYDGNATFACFAAETVLEVDRAGGLDGKMLGMGAVASLICGRPQAELLRRFVLEAERPGENFLALFDHVHSSAARRALADLEAQWPAAAAMPPALVERLVLLFAQLQDGPRTARYARAFAALPGRAEACPALARRILPHGMMDAARELLRATFAGNYAAADADLAVTFAGLLFANGEDDEGMAVLKRMLDKAFEPGAAAAAASLLVDAGKYGLAVDFALAALRETEEKHALPAGLPKDMDAKDVRSLSREDLMALLAHRPTMDPTEARRQLIGLAAFAWNETGGDWPTFLDRILPAVRPWHGEHMVALALHRLDAGRAARSLVEEAFDEAPGNLDLFKAAVDVMVYGDFLEGKAHDASTEKVRRAARRFVKAREGDPDAYRSVAAYLEGKGMYPLAAEMLGELADSSSIDAPVALALGRNQLSLGRYAEAATHFSLATQLGACNRKTLDPVIEDLQRVARLDLAIDIVRECARRFPKDAHIHYLYARVLLGGAGGTAEDETALERLKKAVTLEPAYLEDAARLLHSYDQGEAAWPFLETLARAGDASEAVRALEIGFEIASPSGDVKRMARLGSIASRAHKDAQAATEIAGVYFKYNLTDQGIEKLKQAEGAEDFSSLLLGIRLISTGETEAGLKRFRIHSDKVFGNREEQAGAMDPKEYKTLSVQLDFLEDMGLDGDAVALLEKARKVFPADTMLKLRLVKRRIAMGQVDRAIAMLPEVIREWPGGEERQQLLLVLQQLRSRGRLPAARALIASSVCAHPLDEGCFLPLVLGAALDRDGEAVAQLVARALGTPPLPALQMADAGAELATLGYFDEAEQLLTASLAADGGRPERVLGQIHRVLARVYSATGRRDRIGDLGRMLLLQPGDTSSLRDQLPENLVEYEYLDEARTHLRLMALLEPESQNVELAAFDLLLRQGASDEALTLAMRSSFRATNVLNALLTFASQARRRLAFDLSLELYAAANRLDPTNRALLFAVAELELVTGQSDRALRHFRDYVGETPGRAGRLEEVVRNLAKYNHLARARSLAEESGAPNALLEAGLNLLRAGEKSDGARLVALAIDADPGKGIPVARKVLTFAMLRPRLLPERVRSRCLELACGGPTAGALCRFWEGVAALERGDVAAAGKAFDEQLVGSSETWGYTLAAFRSLLRKGEASAAEELLRKRMIGFNEAQVLNEAIKTIFTLLEEEPLEGPARKAVVELGERLLGDLLDGAPYDFWYRTQQAELLLLAGETDRALRLYEQFIEETPWEPGLYNNLAYLLSKLDRSVDRGLELVQTALSSEPSHSAFYLDTQGWLLYRKGSLEEAEGKVRSALLRSHLGFGDSLAESLYHLGIILRDRGDREQAIRHFGQASFLDPYGEYGGLARDALREMAEDPFRLR
jgi:tetratricopeptide (TPR) repeat protein